MELEAGETVVLEKAANIRKAMEYAGGRVRVTNQRVLLEPHAINLDSQPAAIPLSDIAKVETYSQFGFIPTGVRLTMKDGSQQHFIVFGRKQVIDAIGRVAA
jgi:hypothetical protein